MIATTRPAPARRLRFAGLLVALAAALVAGLAGCGDSESSDAGAGTSAPGGSSLDCDAVALVFQAPVAEDERATALSEEQVVGMMEALRPELAPGLHDDLDYLLRVSTMAPDGPEAAGIDVAQIGRSYEQLVRWSAGACPPERPIWGCLSQNRFEPVGEAIGDPPPDAELAEGDAASAEDAVRGEEDPDLERVEVERSDEQVLFAWVDDDGLALRTAEALRAGSGWMAGATSSCNES